MYIEKIDEHYEKVKSAGAEIVLDNVDQDYGGRGYSVIDAPISDSDLGGLPADLIRHFLESFSREGRFNLHVRLISGVNNHHKAEAIFKSLARSLRSALSHDSKQANQIPSTKGTIV